MGNIQLGLTILLSAHLRGRFVSLQDDGGQLITTDTSDPIILFLE